MKVLDHGSVELIETWGSDERIIEAARMSTSKGFQGWDKDQKLLEFLYEHKHATPFEMAGAVFEIKAPIFVFREWHRHRTQSYNEMSARYIPLPDENYAPLAEDIVVRSGENANKQASSSRECHLPNAKMWLKELTELYALAQRVYSMGIDIGVPKELARLSVPVARYSRMRASANLRNWLAFLTLRMAPNAQWEIRQYADEVAEQLYDVFPRTMELFAKDKNNG